VAASAPTNMPKELSQSDTDATKERTYSPTITINPRIANIRVKRPIFLVVLFCVLIASLELDVFGFKTLLFLLSEELIYLFP
jgi:hypothetical protein